MESDCTQNTLQNKKFTHAQKKKKKKTHLQCVATHSLLQYSLSQSRLSTAGFVHPARTQRFAEAEEETAGATLTSISI